MRKYLLLISGLVALVLAHGGSRAAETVKAPPKPTREILVPFDDLHVLLEDKARRVLLSRREYEELLARATKASETHAPLGAALVCAEYSAKLGDERAEIAGTLTVDVLEPGLHTLGLDVGAVGLRSATLDGRGASLGLADDGRLMLFVEGPGQHRLSLEMVAPLQTTAARQILSFELPTPAATSMRLTVSGDVEVKSGAAVAARVFDDKTEETRIDLLLSPGNTTLVMTLNSRLKRRDRVVVARSVMVDEVTEAYDRLHATFSIAALHRGVDNLRFAVPDGFEVTDVNSAALARWAITSEGTRKVLDIYLREEVTGTVVVNLSALRTNPDLQTWSLPKFEPLDVVGHTAVVGLLLEDRLKVEAVTTRGLLEIDTSVLRRALPATVFEADPAAARIRPVAAYYAPQPTFDLSARFPKPPARLLVTTNLLLVIEESRHEVRGGFAILPEEEKVFSLDISVPAGWDVTSVTASDGATLPFERYGKVKEAARISVRMPKGVPAGEEKRIYVHAVRVPEGWLDDWTGATAEFPVLAVIGATRDVGAIAIDARDDMTVRPQTLERLTPLDENEKTRYGLAGVPASLAFRYEGQPYRATLAAERVRPRLTAQTYSFFRIERDALVAHYELVYDVAQARTRRLELLLPKDTPTELSITGLDGVALKEFTSEPAGEMRRWTAVLADRRGGEVKLAVDFQQKLTENQLRNLTLPVVQADRVAYQSGIVSVEGCAELEIKVLEPPRKVDIGELVDAKYQPGPRLLGVFGYVGDAPTVKLAVSREPAYELPPAIVQQTELSTRLSADGVSQTWARFRLRTKALFLEVKLPEHSTLWSATLDGRPAKPQHEKDRLLLNLPAGDEKTVRELLVVYETPAKPIRFWSRLEIPAPCLFLYTESQKTSVQVPVADLIWRLYVPEGYKVVRSDGTVVTHQVKPPTLAVNNLAVALFYATGGVGTDRGLLSGPTLGRARMSRVSREKAEYLLETDLVTKERAAEGRGGLQLGARNELKAEAPTAELTPTTPGPTPAVPTKPPAGEKRPEDKEPSALAGWRRDGATYYKLEGLRSLQIDLQEPGEGITFRSLGTAPRLGVTITNDRRLGAFAWALGLGVLLAGVVMTTKPVRQKATYILAVALAATLLPVITGEVELALMVNGAFYAACVLTLYYLLAGLVRRVRGKARRAAGVAATVMLATLTVVLGVASVRAAEPEKPYVVQIVGPEPPVKVPADAVILPYDAEARFGFPGPTQMLIPYDRFVELWNLAYPDKKIGSEAPSAPYALSGAAFHATLEGNEFLLVEGSVDISVFTDTYASVPLPLEGGVLAKADLEGRPARLSVVQPEATPSSQQQAPMKSAPDLHDRSFVVAYVSGKGVHRLDLAVRLKLERRGGWRVAEGRLPAAPATALTLDVPAAQTEVRLGGVSDRRTYETKLPGQKINTALGANGQISVEWRPKVQEGQIDQTLTVDSVGSFDVQEDQLRLAWALSLNFRRGLREFFSVELPDGYLVEKVEGANVRGWELKSSDGKSRLEVSLLKKAKEQEQFEVYLWRPGAVGTPGLASFDVPVVSVTGAIRHSGQVTIRRSPLLDIQTVSTAGVTRTDVAALPANAPRTGLVVDESPLGLRPYQAYLFVAMPFSIKLSAEPVTAKTSASVQTVLRISERERNLESRVVVSAQRRLVYRVRVVVPGDIRIDRVSAPGEFEWALTDEASRKVLTVYMGAGIQGQIPVVVRGTLGKEEKVQAADLPQFEVLDVEDQQGDIAVQVDPAFDVRAEDLKNIENVLVSRLYGWLAPAQQGLTRLALHYKSAGYSGRLTLTARKPDVACYTLTNVRVTDRAIEETILMDFTIHNAGIRDLAFLLPARVKDARIRVPLLRQKTVETTADLQVVRVRLELQDPVMNQLRVLVENDRLLTAEVHEAPIPVVETGRTLHRYVSLESTGRDEVVVEAASGLDALSPRSEAWSTVAGLLRGGNTRAYAVKADAAAPRLAFRTKERKLVETPEARIGLARTLLVLDSSGAYRAEQLYMVTNSIEQFLEVELPEGASIWTARVAGQLVKPTRVPLKDKADHVRIPLVKTAEGDLDYAVVLKYGGALKPLWSFRLVTMPLIRTVNIKPELSQVELFLSETHKWVRFDGTMREVKREGDFEAGVVAYWNTVGQRLVKTTQYGNPYAQERARSNLKSVTESLGRVQMGDTQAYRDNDYYQKELDQSKLVLKDANKLIQETVQPQTWDEIGNRDVMSRSFTAQGNVRAQGQVKDLDANFAPPEETAPAGGQVTMNEEWLARNALKQAPPTEKLKAIDRVVDMRKKLAGKGAKSDQPNAPDIAQEDLKSQIVTEGEQQQAQRMSPQQSRETKDVVRRYQKQLETHAELQKQQKAEVEPGAPDWITSEGHMRTRTRVYDVRDLTTGIPDFSGAKFDLQGIATGLTSLDVELPRRGVRYQFTTPRGEVLITARPVSSKFLAALAPLAIVVFAILLVMGVQRLKGRGGRLTIEAQSMISTLVIILGTIGLLVGIFPVLGLAALAASIVWKVRVRRARRKAAA